MKQEKNKSLRGYLVLEALIAIVMFGVLVVAIFPTITFLLQRNRRLKYDGQASLLLQEGLESTYNILAYNPLNWSSYNNTDMYHPVPVVGAGWTLDVGDEPDLETRFTRSIKFADVCRDTDGTRVVCPGGTVDPKSRLVTATVTWDESGPKSIQAELLLVNLK